MLLLVSGSQKTILRDRERLPYGRHLGRLIHPRAGWEKAGEDGVPWAADNDAFSGFEEVRYLAMLEGIKGKAGCHFVTAPDVVADAEQTMRLWSLWGSRIRALGLPSCLVLQDGLGGPGDVPWPELDAVFVGGSTDFKLGPIAAAICREARRRDVWVHMGRVNGGRRMRYAREIGCQSVDGSKYARFRDAHLPRGLEDAAHGQLSLLGD